MTKRAEEDTTTINWNDCPRCHGHKMLWGTIPEICPDCRGTGKDVHAWTKKTK